MPATAVIDTGDALPDTFTFTAVLGTSPYSYTIDITGIENSGITFVVSGAENNVVDFDATNARGGEYVINLRGTVLDTPGQRHSDVDNYFVTVHPIIAAWAPGSLSIPSLDQGATSAESATLTVSSGGAAPYTYHLSWLAGQSPVAGMSIEQLDEDDNVIEITIDGTVQAGTYQGTIIAEVGDVTGQRQVVDQIDVSVTVDGMVDWVYSPLQVTALTDEETATNTDAATLGGGSGGVAPYTYTHGFFSSPEPGLILSTSGGDGEIVQVNTSDSMEVGTHTGTVRGRVTDAAANFVETFLDYRVEVTEVAQLVATDGIIWDGAMSSVSISTDVVGMTLTHNADRHTPFAGSFHMLQLTLAGSRTLAAHVDDITLNGVSLEGGNDFEDYLMYRQFGPWGATSMTAFLFVVRDTDPAFPVGDERGPWEFVMTWAGGFDGTAVARYTTGSYMPTEGVVADIPEIIITGEGNPIKPLLFDIAPHPDQFYIPLSGPGIVGGELLAGYAVHMDGIEQIITSNFANMLTFGDDGNQETNLQSLRPVNIMSRRLSIYRGGRSANAPLEQGSPSPGDSLVYTAGLTDVSQAGTWTCLLWPPLTVPDTSYTPLMRNHNPEHWWRFQTRATPTTDPIPDEGNQGVELDDSFTPNDGPNDYNTAGQDTDWEGLSGSLNMEDGLNNYSISDTITTSATGTVLFLFRHPTNTPPANAQGLAPMWNYGRQGNAGECFQLNCEDADGLSWRTNNALTDVAANNFVRTYDMTDLDFASGFHLAAMVKHNDGEPPDLFIDGGMITSFSDVEGGSSDKGMWFDSVTSSEQFSVGSASVEAALGWDGTIDEIVIFFTKEMTQLELQELCLGLGLAIRGDG